jgi:putative Holliday junction resolvase
MKMLGIDFGTKNIGLAISDEAGIAAYPRQVIRNDQKLIEVIAKLVQDEDIGTIVLGESIDQSGQENAIMRHVRKFV